MRNQLPPHIQTWLNGRGITDAIIDAADIGWNGKEIVIPVRDTDGTLLFNKYRRDPANTDGPKYRYEAGSASAVYGLPSLLKGGPVIICEGEFDALRMQSLGFSAVSSTGGSGTFMQDWQEYFLNREVLICYDNDKPGFSGAFKVQSIIPWARIIWLPATVGEHGDLTDYFGRCGKTLVDFTALMFRSKTYVIPKDWSAMETKKELTVIKKEYQFEMERLLEETRNLKAKRESDAPIQVLLEMYRNEYDRVSRQLKYFSVTRDKMNPDRIIAAKAIPIPQYIKFDRTKTAKCLWHDDSSPSMHYYEKQNRVHCFGCGKGGDVIDVVQVLNRCDLQEALRIILQDNG